MEHEKAQGGHQESRFSSHVAGSLISCSDLVRLRRQTLACRPQPGAHSLPRCPSAWWVNSAAGSSGPETHQEEPELHTSFHSGKRVRHEMVTHLSNTDTHLANITDIRMGLPRLRDTPHQHKHIPSQNHTEEDRKARSWLHTHTHTKADMYANIAVRRTRLPNMPYKHRRKHKHIAPIQKPRQNHTKEVQLSGSDTHTHTAQVDMVDRNWLHT